VLANQQTPPLCQTAQVPSRLPSQLINFFSINNELDMLEIHFQEYWDLVDTFVVMESSLTFSNQQKPLHLAPALCTPRFAPYLPKLVHVVLDASLRGPNDDAWAWEAAHRVCRPCACTSAAFHSYRDRCCGSAALKPPPVTLSWSELGGLPRPLLCAPLTLCLQDAMQAVGNLLGLQPTDLLLSGDVDELPYASAVAEGANIVWNSLAADNSTLPVVEWGLTMYYFRWRGGPRTLLDGTRTAGQTPCLPAWSLHPTSCLPSTAPSLPFHPLCLPCSLFHQVPEPWEHYAKVYPFAVGEVASFSAMRVRHDQCEGCHYPSDRIKASVCTASLPSCTARCQIQQQRGQNDSCHAILSASVCMRGRREEGRAELHATRLGG
jgi:hypothetical protein